MVKEINLCWYFLFYASYAIKRPYTFLYERGERTSADLVYTCSIVKYRNTSTIDVVWWCDDVQTKSVKRKNRREKTGFCVLFQFDCRSTSTSFFWCLAVHVFIYIFLLLLPVSCRSLLLLLFVLRLFLLLDRFTEFSLLCIHTHIYAHRQIYIKNDAIALLVVRSLFVFQSLHLIF